MNWDFEGIRIAFVDETAVVNVLPGFSLTF